MARGTAEGVDGEERIRRTGARSASAGISLTFSPQISGNNISVLAHTRLVLLTGFCDLPLYIQPHAEKPDEQHYHAI